MGVVDARVNVPLHPVPVRSGLPDRRKFRVVKGSAFLLYHHGQGTNLVSNFWSAGCLMEKQKWKMILLKNRLQPWARTNAEGCVRVVRRLEDL